MTSSDRLKVSMQASELEAPLGPGPPDVPLVATSSCRACGVSVADSKANGVE